MEGKYRATIHGNVVDWHGDSPSDLKIDGEVTVDVTVVPRIDKWKKPDVKKMVQGFPAFASYWSVLDRNFPELLNRLVIDYSSDVIEKFWIEQIIQASDRAWELTRNSVGDDAFALRAIYSAEGSLRIAQKPFREKLKPAKESA